MKGIRPRRHAIRSVALMLAGLAGCCGCAAQAEEKALYGKDDRIEVSAADAELRSAARSVAALFQSDALDRLPGRGWRLPEEAVGPKSNWCPSERFGDQPGGALCTGFLIGPDRIATSAHCIRATADRFAPGVACGQARFVFDYHVDHRGQAMTRPTPDRVYRCEAVLAGEGNRAGADWQVVKLDRPVSERAPLPVHDGDPLPVGTSLEVIGHPSGLPAKISAGGRLVEQRDAGYFVTDLDTYQGNSGSPVLARVDARRTVIGLLSRGARDFETRSSDGDTCEVSRVCDVASCGGEHATWAGAFLEHARRARGDRPR